MKLERIARIAIVLALVGAFAVAVWAYPRLPVRVPSHWNAAGEVDGYTSRAFGAFGFPIIMLGLGTLLLFLPRIDPLKKNIETFLTEYHVFVAVFELFFLALYVQTILWALGTEISINVAVSIGCGLLFLCVGWMMGRAKRNFFIGIRTPWTLMNDDVWARTHALGSKLFYAASALTLLGALVADYAVWILLVSTLLAAGISVVYSYVIYQRLVPTDGPQGPPPARG